VLGVATHLPSDLGDPVLSAWTLAWDASRMAHGFPRPVERRNFFPYRHTLAYSDHLLGVALFTAPVQWLTGNPILVYNLAFLASATLAGVGCTSLLESLSDGATPRSSQASFTPACRSASLIWRTCSGS